MGRGGGSRTRAEHRWRGLWGQGNGPRARRRDVMAIGL